MALHVGYGTFSPIRPITRSAEMHAEQYHIDPQTASNLVDDINEKEKFLQLEPQWRTLESFMKDPLKQGAMKVNYLYIRVMNLNVSTVSLQTFISPFDIIVVSAFSSFK